MRSFTSVAAAAMLYAGSSMAAGLNFCLSSNQDLCYDFAVPQTSAQSGSGNFYFQMRAPTSYAWVALGTGTRMAGSNIFVMYQDGSGNVTISPRSGTGHNEPQYNADGAKLELLEGSGVSNGMMVANVRCANCETWDGGSLDYAGTSNFITAWKSGSMSSSQPNARISQHDDRLAFQLNLGDASVSTNAAVNPFVSTPSGDNTSENNNNNDDDNNDKNNYDNNNNDKGNDKGNDKDNNKNNANGNSPITVGGTSNLAAAKRKLVIHGVLMGLTFVALYPTGAFLQPLLKKWFVHAGWQTVAFIIMWVGFGFGYVLAQDSGMLFNNTHTILGTVVCSLMVLQPILGFLHHQHFVKYQARGTFSYAHIFYGRSLMILGIINGGLGLKLASAPNQAVIAYIVVTIALFLLYAVISITSEMRRSRAAVSRTPRQPHKQRTGSA